VSARHSNSCADGVRQKEKLSEKRREKNNDRTDRVKEPGKAKKSSMTGKVTKLKLILYLKSL